MGRTVVYTRIVYGAIAAIASEDAIGRLRRLNDICATANAVWVEVHQASKISASIAAVSPSADRC